MVGVGVWASNAAPVAGHTSETNWAVQRMGWQAELVLTLFFSILIFLRQNENWEEKKKQATSKQANGDWFLLVEYPLENMDVLGEVNERMGNLFNGFSVSWGHVNEFKIISQCMQPARWRCGGGGGGGLKLKGETGGRFEQEVFWCCVVWLEKEVVKSGWIKSRSHAIRIFLLCVYNIKNMCSTERRRRARARPHCMQRNYWYTYTDSLFSERWFHELVHISQNEIEEKRTVYPETWCTKWKYLSVLCWCCLAMAEWLSWV